ncbi:MAG: leucine-rich repeat domain-containing protein [Crocinitomicaceae bacterium]
MKVLTSVFYSICLLAGSAVHSQTQTDTVNIKKEYINIDSALAHSADVYRLNLSNQAFSIPDSVWSKFTNLEYLSLKNDHIKELPEGLFSLKNLKVLDLSGNDFVSLPVAFSQLVNLEELYLNDEKHFQFDQSISILSELPKLRSLHVEGDSLTSLPKDIHKLSHLEALYLNNNQFKQVPIELKGLENLHYLDLHDNKFTVPAQSTPNPGFGFKIRF